MTFSTIKSKLDDLAAELQAIDASVSALGDSATAIQAKLDALPESYGDLIADVDAEADGSDDPAILAAKAEKDLMVAEYLATSSTVVNVQTALS